MSVKPEYIEDIDTAAARAIHVNQLGRAAYEAHFNSISKSLGIETTAKPFCFDALPASIREAWLASGKAVEELVQGK